MRSIGAEYVNSTKYGKTTEYNYKFKNAMIYFDTLGRVVALRCGTYVCLFNLQDDVSNWKVPTVDKSSLMYNRTLPPINE